MVLICVVMNTKTPNHYLDTRELFEWGFDNFSQWNISENEDSEDLKESFFDASSDIFDTGDALATIDEDSQLTLPKGVDFDDTQMTITSEDGDPKAIYTYEDHVVGTASVTYSLDSAKQASSFSLPSDRYGDGEDVILIPLIWVVYGGIGVVCAAALIVLIVYLVKNYYILRHRWNSRHGESLDLQSLGHEKKPKKKHWWNRKKDDYI